MLLFATASKHMEIFQQIKPRKKKPSQSCHDNKTPIHEHLFIKKLLHQRIHQQVPDPLPSVPYQGISLEAPVLGTDDIDLAEPVYE